MRCETFGIFFLLLGLSRATVHIDASQLVDLDAFACLKSKDEICETWEKVLNSRMGLRHEKDIDLLSSRLEDLSVGSRKGAHNSHRHGLKYVRQSEAEQIYFSEFTLEGKTFSQRYREVTFS